MRWNALQRAVLILVGCLAALAPPALAAPVVRATELISRSVANAQGETIGEVVDLLVDLSSAAAPYAVIERRGAGRYVYPLNALRFEGGVLSVEDERDAFAAAPGHGPSAKTGRLLSVQRLIGRDVVFHDGEDAGEVRDVHVDLANGALESVTLAYEPVYGDAPIGVRPRRLHAPPGAGPLVLGSGPEPRPADGINVLPSDERRSVQGPYPQSD